MLRIVNAAVFDDTSGKRVLQPHYEQNCRTANVLPHEALLLRSGLASAANCWLRTVLVQFDEEWNETRPSLAVGKESANAIPSLTSPVDEERERN